MSPVHIAPNAASGGVILRTSRRPRPSGRVRLVAVRADRGEVSRSDAASSWVVILLLRTAGRLDAEHDWLRVTTAVSDDALWDGKHGPIGEVAVASGDWSGHDAYVCGAPPGVGS